MSFIATRKAYGEALLEEGKKNKDIVALDADLSVSTMSCLFAKEFPERFFQMGIAEANMIGTAAGLSLTGKIPFISSFACFVVGRYDMIRISVAYQKANVKIVGSHAGIGIGEDGSTQMGLEDVNLIRGLPNFNVFQPSSDKETREIIKYMANNEGPMYLRTTRQAMEEVAIEKREFKFGKANILKEGSDLTIFSTGALTESAYHAADELGKEGISLRVVDVHTIKPIDIDAIVDAANKTKGILTAEDHNIIGGLGSAVAEVLAEHSPCKMYRIGMRDRFGESGIGKDLYKKYKFDKDGVIEQVKDFAKKVL